MNFETYQSYKIIEAAKVAAGSIKTRRGIGPGPRHIANTVDGTTLEIPENIFNEVSPSINDSFYIIRENGKYTGWLSPDDFEAEYKKIEFETDDNVDFPYALSELKVKPETMSAYRTGWNAQGLRIAYKVPDVKNVITRPCLMMYIPKGVSNHLDDLKDVNGNVIPWIPSQTDMFARDWCIQFYPEGLFK